MNNQIDFLVVSPMKMYMYTHAVSVEYRPLALPVMYVMLNGLSFFTYVLDMNDL